MEVFPFLTIMIHIKTVSDLFQVWQKWPSNPQTCADRTGEMRKEFWFGVWVCPSLLVCLLSCPTNNTNKKKLKWQVLSSKEMQYKPSISLSWPVHTNTASCYNWFLPLCIHRFRCIFNDWKSVMPYVLWVYVQNGEREK